MLQWIIAKLLAWYAGPVAQQLITAGINDLVSTGQDLASAALQYAKEAQQNNLENKFDYVQEKMIAKFSDVSKNKLNSAIELAASVLAQQAGK
jgi:hypothetical protein